MTYLSQLPEADRLREMDRLYRIVFSTPEGRIVFADLLQTMYLFEIPETNEHHAVRDYGTALMMRVLSNDSHSLVDAMLNVPKEEF